MKSITLSLPTETVLAIIRNIVAKSTPNICFEETLTAFINTQNTVLRTLNDLRRVYEDEDAENQHTSFYYHLSCEIKGSETLINLFTISRKALSKTDLTIEEIQFLQQYIIDNTN